MKPEKEGLLAEVTALREDLADFFRRRHFDEEEAGDLTQTVLARACEKIGTYRGDGPLKNWVYQIARNHLKNWYRTSTHERQHLVRIPRNAEWAASSGGLPAAEEILFKKEKKQRLYQAMKSLAMRRRQCLELFIGGCSHEEIARIMKMEPVTVRSTLHQTMRQLRDRLSGDG